MKSVVRINEAISKELSGTQPTDFLHMYRRASEGREGTEFWRTSQMAPHSSESAVNKAAWTDHGWHGMDQSQVEVP
jgi:hypothetical protein